MAFKIYTKTGDSGETGLFGGKRLPKDDLRVEAYGTVDELNAYIGLLRDHLAKEASIASLLKEVQDRLFTIGSNLASDPDKEMITPDVSEGDIDMLESAIDAMNAELPALKHFILPGGHPVVSHAHIARCVCRRAERRVVALSQQSTVLPVLIKYLNRLSDYLFVLARFLAKVNQAEEVIWTPRKDK
jgi:cob(I)alamin adenosyltransferase